MSAPLTAADARQSLTDHVAAKGVEVFLKYGPHLGWSGLARLLADRAYVRYPCRIVFDAAPLAAGEFAFPEPVGATPEEGFTMVVHPAFARDLDELPALVLYQLVVVNYGAFASCDEAECFGAAALGLTRGEYYARLCALADRVAAPAEDAPESTDGSCRAGCGCGGD
jgi:hypothetical protein